MPGTSVTITGSNFTLPANNNRVRVNITSQPVNSATGINLIMKIAPATTSGHISLSTPYGKTVSAQDFFIPFLNHAVSEVGFTGRVNVGGTQTLTLNAPNQIGLLLFDARAGQKVSLQTSGSTFAQCSWLLFAPAGGQSMNTGGCQAGAGSSDLSLPSDGTYTIGITPATSTGSVNFSLTDKSDVSGAITIDGPPVTVATTFAGQDAALSFDNFIPNRRVVVYATNVSNLGATVYIVKPGGGLLPLSMGINNSPAGQVFFLDAQTLAAVGTYQLWIAHSGNNFGSETLQLVSVQDVTGTLTVPQPGATGPAVTVTTTMPGQNARLTFNAAAGQKLSFNLSNASIGHIFSDCSLTVWDPHNTQVSIFPFRDGYCGVGGDSYIDNVTLAVSGTYTVLINPRDMLTGSLTVSINNPADVNGTIGIDDASPTTASTTVPGQDARLSFTTTTANQRVFMLVSNVSNPGATVWIVKPDQTILTGSQTVINSNPAGQTFFMDTQTLAVAGTYQLWVQHNGNSVGSESLKLNSVPPDFTGTLTIGDPTAVRVPTTGSLAPGQNGYLTFSGTQGQALTIHVSNNTTASPTYLDLFDSANNLVDSTNIGGSSSFNRSISSLPATGVYTIKVDPQGTITGSMTINVTTP